jgi:hypothetical protein
MQPASANDMTSNPSPTSTLTRPWLICGVIAGPLYVLVGGTEMLTRPGYDATRHESPPDEQRRPGWIHSSLLILTGLLTCACAVGMRRVLHGSRGRTWGPILLGIYGLGLIGAGFFSADAALGFPPATPASAHARGQVTCYEYINGKKLKALEQQKENILRKVIVSEYVTQDGVMEDPGGLTRFKDGNWHFPSWSEETNKYKFEELFGVRHLSASSKSARFP